MFGDKLKKLRETHGLSQQQLAEKLGMSPSGIGMWELLFSTIFVFNR